MTPTGHKLYISFFTIVVIVTTVILVVIGFTYYSTDLENRFFNASHELLKPSGIAGHGFGIVGSFLMLFGVFSYMARKRIRTFSRVGILKYWLEFHIFLCTLGPILILFHTSFKFGGIVAVSFWSMVAVVASGVIGRFIYLQIPRSIEGRELSLNEVRGLKSDLTSTLKETYGLDDEIITVIKEFTISKSLVYHKNELIRIIKRSQYNRIALKKVKASLKNSHLSRKEYLQILSFINNEVSIDRKIEQLHTMQRLFKHWHVAHLPFALVMIIIMLIHIAVTITFGYKWIF